MVGVKLLLLAKLTTIQYIGLGCGSLVVNVTKSYRPFQTIITQKLKKFH